MNQILLINLVVGFEALSVSTKGRIEAGVNERIYASAGGDLSAFRYKDHLGDLKFANYSASAEAGIGENGASAKYKLGVDVVNAKVGGVKGNLGLMLVPKLLLAREA